MYPEINTVINTFLKLYKEDRDPFLSDTTVDFSPRVFNFEELKLIKKLMFPNYWNSGPKTGEVKDYGRVVRDILDELRELFVKGVSPYLQKNGEALEIVDKVLNQLPMIRAKLKKDVQAAYEGDPAAKSYTEIIRCYPFLSAMEIQRIAHVFYNVGAISYARELTEQIHYKTGIDIHPGATIGDYFFIDHGTGVVIGETSKIGNWVRIYQGVTLGGRSFHNVDANRNKKRHPTIKDKVIIYANATILGGDTIIGEGCIIGGDVWITESVLPNTTVIQGEPNLRYEKVE